MMQNQSLGGAPAFQDGQNLKSCLHSATHDGRVGAASMNSHDVRQSGDLGSLRNIDGCRNHDQGRIGGERGDADLEFRSA